MRAGSTPVPQPKWSLDAKSRRFDVMANFYAGPDSRCWLLQCADYVSSGGLSKFSAAKQLLQPDLLDRYLGVLFLDDDIETLFDPSAFMEFATQQRFDLAQASLSADSVAGHRVCLNHPSCAWRETNFVEVMAPYFSATLLKLAIGDFDRSISSWGLDVLWGVRYGMTHRIAIVDLFTMTHRRASDLHSGAFYRYLRSIDIDPLKEARQIFNELGLDRFEIVTRRVIARDEGIQLPPP